LLQFFTGVETWNKSSKTDSEPQRDDPIKIQLASSALRLALQNAASTAGLMLTTEALIEDIKEDEKKGAGAGGGMPGGGGGMGGMC
jgi:hypothetical protein